MGIVEHDALHRVFSNKLPHEQILQLIALNRDALRSEFMDLVTELMNLAPEDIYNPSAFRKQKDIDAVRDETEERIRRTIIDNPNDAPMQ